MWRRTWYAPGLAVALLVGACTGDDQPEPDGVSSSPPATPRPQVGSWTSVAELPQVRTELSAVALDGQVYAGGGLTQPP